MKAPKTNAGLNLKRSDAMVGLLMIAPVVILISIFSVFPLLWSMRISVMNWSFYETPSFVGINNFKMVLTDAKFRSSIVVGLKLAGLLMSSMLVFTFLFSHVLKALKGRLGGFVKTSVYVPTVISGIIGSVIFMFIFDYKGGVLNVVLDLLGFEKVAWLANPQTALVSIVIVAFWMGFGYTSLLMLAGLNDIPGMYYEAASMDGANWLQKMWHITIPQMRNIVVFIVITGMSGALQMFDLPFMMTSGGPLEKTLTPVLLIYQHFTKDQTIGYAIAGSLVIFVILGAISAFIFKVIQSEKSLE